MFWQTETLSKRRAAGGSGLSLSQPLGPGPAPLPAGGRVRAVEVARGRAGYGFTLSGQGPCLLSCILKGSPAEYVGLRSGDHILDVNDINVSKASHEDVVKLIGRCTGVLRLVIAEGERHRRHHHHHHQRAAANRTPQPPAAYLDSGSSDDEYDRHPGGGANNNGKPGQGPHGGGGGGWYKPKMDPKQLGINRAERVVAELQSGGIFNMIFENSSHSSSSSDKERAAVTSPPAAAAAAAAASKPRRPSEPEYPSYRKTSRSRSNPNLLSEEEMVRFLNEDSVFLDPDFHHLSLQDREQRDVEVEEEEEEEERGADLGLEAGEDILNVGMMVGYLGSIELASTGASLESDSIQAIRGSMRRLRAEQKIHSLVLMKVMHDSVRLCNDRGQVLATYPAEKLAFSACCPDDRRFFGLVTMQATDDEGDPRYGHQDDGGLRTSCHVFIVDPDLCHHQAHSGVARRFGFDCTPDPDTGGCLEFPPTSQPLLQFVSVLYRDMGESIEGVRARAFHDPDHDAQQNHSTSSNSDSGIGNFLAEEKSNRVLLVDLGGPASHHWDSPPPPPPPPHQAAWSSGQAHPLPPPPPPPPPPPALRNGHYRHHEPQHLADLHHPLPRAVPPPHHYPTAKRGGDKRGGGAGGGAGGGLEQQQQRWLPVHVLRDWRQQHLQAGAGSDQESYAESTDGWSSANCSTLPPPMSKIPADRYRAPLAPGDHLPPPPPPPPLTPAAGSQRTPPQAPSARAAAHKDEWARRLFGAGERDRERDKGRDRERERERDRPGGGRERKRGSAKTEEKKAGRFRGLTRGFPPLPQRSGARRSFGRSKRLSLARSLDDLEDALSDLTLVGEGDINSPHLSYVTPSALLPKPRPRLPSSRQQEAPPLAPPPPPPHDGGPPSAGKDRGGRRRGKERGGSFRLPGRRAPFSNPKPLPPPPPPPPPRLPLRSRRKSKSPASRPPHHPPTKAPLDLDNICVGRGEAGDPRRGRRGSRDTRLAPAAAATATLEQKWGGVASELRCRGGRMRSAVYQTSDLPSMVAVKVGADDPPEARRNGHLDRSNFKATFV
ncbi:regulator of G-protein signaling 12-like [Gadus chalcogrammus]|uniref:regulator of G-protein signaling 12-like n=1 Tax=Gadus chalcogrammus TaxID=1042646 RepID=UPI0024C3A5F1|nr:regulator of G-protein signaling 12-like [Gadus chalcogrammus]